MGFFSFFSKPLPSVAFATCCWERDWRQILLDPVYLPKKQIAHHCFPFAEKILIINNVNDLAAVKRAAEKWLDAAVLTRIIVAQESVLNSFRLKRGDFRMGDDAHLYNNVNADWIYYNALGPLTAIHECQSDYLLYLTGDVRLDEPIDWISPALRLMEKEKRYKVANPIWNGKIDEAKRESIRQRGDFFIAAEGFSDQLFLVPVADFRAPIYNEIRGDANHFPRGDVFEKRAYSAMKNRGWERLIYRHGSYTHENF